MYRWLDEWTDRQTDKQSDGQTNKQIDGTNVHEGYQLKSPYDLIFEVHGYIYIHVYVHVHTSYVHALVIII